MKKTDKLQNANKRKNRLFIQEIKCSKILAKILQFSKIMEYLC